MTNRSRRQAASRAEARRRARYQATGRDDEELGEEDEEDSEPAATARAPGAGGFLTRLFPPAPPLPGKPDPLADYAYRGPFSGVVSGLYLLWRNPVAWLLPMAGWIVGRILTAMSIGVLEIVATILTFMALLAAGWLGWQRPWLFGLATAVVGSLVFAGVWAALIGQLPDVSEQYSVMQLFVAFSLQETFQWLFGLLGGWYGGYLRRRSITPARPGSSRRR
jgi:hypothetical protein